MAKQKVEKKLITKETNKPRDNLIIAKFPHYNLEPGRE